MDTSLEAIRKRIFDRKEELDLSYQDMADSTGLSKSTLQRYITGDIRNLGLDKLELLAKALRVTPGYLMGWENVPKEYENEETILIARKLNKLDQSQIDLINSIIDEFENDKDK